MKKKSGFTLIELLAVIVILAIILLIAVPIVLNVIEDAKKGAFKSSAGYLIKAAENKYLTNQLNGTEEDLVYIYEDGKIKGEKNLDYKGETPKNGIIVVRKDGKIGIAIDNGKWCARKEYNEGNIKFIELRNNDCKLENIPYVDNQFNEGKGVNKPKLSTGMIPVKWNENNEEIDTTEDDPEWYDYNAKKWANVKTADGSYWVWIPRYAYKITSGYHTSGVGIIDVKFLKGITNNSIDSTKIENNGYEVGVKDTSMHYFVHPAFTFGNTELNGLWIAKFEPTAKEGVATLYGATECNPLDNSRDKTIQILPGVSSWRCINMKEAHHASLNMKNNSIYGWLSNEVEPHVMKNIEWGVVLYLTESKYGANEEVWKNSYRQFQTGCGSSTITSNTENICIHYNSEIGVKASTTHNITGIYDMSGGAVERVMANYNNLSGQTLSGSGYTHEELENLDDKYIDKYATLDIEMLNSEGMDYDKTKYGDAVYEISLDAARYDGEKWINNTRNSWYSNPSQLPRVYYPWFDRGGHYTGSGIYYFNASGGNGNKTFSFRPAVIVK